MGQELASLRRITVIQGEERRLEIIAKAGSDKWIRQKDAVGRIR